MTGHAPRQGGRSIDQLRRSLEQLSGARLPTGDGPVAAPVDDRPRAPAAPATRADAPTKASAGPPRKASTQVSERASTKVCKEAPTAAPAPTSGVAIDPRIRRRRIDVRRDEGRKRLRILLGCVAVVVLALAVGGAGRSPLFDVDYVDVRGLDQTARSEVVDAGGLRGHPALLDVDTGEVAGQVEALPWVLDATARREWPGTIRIDITERRPAAVLPATAGRWALADRTGRILRIGGEKPSGLPVIGNIEPPERAGDSVAVAATPSLRVAAELPPSVRERVADIATLEGGVVELQLVPPGGVVRLGPPVDLDEKLSVLATVLQGADLASVRVIDVRVPRAPALTRH